MATLGKKRHTSLGYARRIPAPIPKLMSYAEFLKTDFENPHVEWVNGRVVPMSPINEEHQNLDGLLVAVLRTFAEERKLGRVLFDPFQMKTGPDLPGRAPDILFTSNARMKRLKKSHLTAPLTWRSKSSAPAAGAGIARKNSVNTR